MGKRFIVEKNRRWRKGFKKASVLDCIEFLKTIDVVSVDIETTRKYNKYEMEGLDPRTSNIVMLQVGDAHTQYVIDARDFDIKPIIVTIKNKLIVGTNLKFEYKHLYHNTGVKLEHLFDIMIVEQILKNGYFLPANLEALVDRYLDIQLPPTSALSFLTIGDKPFTQRQIEYGADDIMYPMLVRDFQLTQIEAHEFEKVVSLENLFIPVLGDMEYTGMYLNQEKWLKLAKENTEEYKRLGDALNNFVIETHFESNFVDKQYDMFDTSFKCRISWSSPTQVTEYFKFLGVCPMAKSDSTGEMRYTVNADLLRSHIPQVVDEVEPIYIDFVHLYLKYKEIEKSSTTYGEEFLKHVHPISGRLHSSYRQIVNTGRMSSSKPIKLGVISVMI